MRNPVTCGTCGTVVEAPVEDVGVKVAELERELSESETNCGIAMAGEMEARTKLAELEGGSFNINHYVWVRLTDRGRAILAEQHDELSARLAYAHPYTPVTEDENGWSKWQLWSLMHELGGDHCRMGPTTPFETEIRFTDPVLVAAMAGGDGDD